MLLSALLMLALGGAQAQVSFSRQDLRESRDIIQHLLRLNRAQHLDGSAVVYHDDLRRLYRQRAYRPLWFSTQGPRPMVTALVATLAEAEKEGLSPVSFLGLLQAIKSAPADVLQLAELELLLSDRFFDYIQQVGNGRFQPQAMDKEWFILPESFDRVAVLEQVLDAELDLATVLGRMPPPHSGYRRLREQLAHYRELAAWGGWPALGSGKTLRQGEQDERVPVLRERLRISGDLRPEQDEGTNELFDPALASALLRFQRRHGLLADGRLGPDTLVALNVSVQERVQQLLINMERWRWLPRHAEAKYLLVNMAGFELQVFERHQPVMNMRVIVGRDYRQTPVFNTQLTSLIINPYWYVPPTVLEHDLLPRLKRDPTQLHRMGMKLFSSLEGHGTEVAPESIDWQQVDVARFPYIVRQNPGPSNALGGFKFTLTNHYGIYFHDTPHHELFDRPVRALSSGCIRLEDPLALAEYLFKGDARGERQWLEAQHAEGRTRRLELSDAIPVYLVYWTAWVDSEGLLHFRDDIYGRDSGLLKAIQQADMPQPLTYTDNEHDSE